MKPDLETILDDCLMRLKAGANPQTLLAEHPDQADELAGLLRAASIVSRLPTPQASSEAYFNGMQRMLDANVTQAAPAVQDQKDVQKQ